MDTVTIELATVLVHITSTFGFITNSIAVLTIVKCVNMHTSFGVLCAANHCVLVLLNSTWYALPDTGSFEKGSILSRIIGMVGTVLWITGIRFHLLISINRLIAIVFPFKRNILENAKTTAVGVGCAILATVLQCLPLGIAEDIWFCFDRTSMQWTHSQTPIGLFYWGYFVDLSNMVEITSVFVIDFLTLLHLRMHRSQPGNNHPNTSSFDSRAVEVRLYKQALSQSLPLLLVLTCFVFVTPRMSDNFVKFLTTTFVWHLAHGFDGLIIDIFHTRKDLFFKKKKKDLSVTVGSSSAHKSIV